MSRYSNIQRILSEFHKGELFTISDIVKKFPDLNQTTIYRNVERLLKEGRIKERKIQKGTSSYELMDHNHQHFVCKMCNRIFTFDFDDSNVKKVLEKVGLEVDDLEINASGKCDKCKYK